MSPYSFDKPNRNGLDNCEGLNIFYRCFQITFCMYSHLKVLTYSQQENFQLLIFNSLA